MSRSAKQETPTNEEAGAEDSMKTETKMTTSETTQETKDMQDIEQIHEEEEIVIPAAANALAPPRPEDIEEADDRDENFGNRIDYEPKNQGIYRSPMQGGNQWGQQRHNGGRNRHHRHHQQMQQEQPGVLTIRQPGWKDRAESAEQEQTSDVLTIRRQGNLARSLRHSQNREHTYISKPSRNSTNNNRGQQNRRRRNTKR